MSHQLVGILQMNLCHVHGIKLLNYGIWIQYNLYKLLLVSIQRNHYSKKKRNLFIFRNVEKVSYHLIYHQ